MMDACHHTICVSIARHFNCILTLPILAINILVSTAFIDENQGYNGGDFEASSMPEQNRQKAYKEGGFRKAIIG